jgi:LPXTG-motif cell wall-anchored protein
VTYTKIRGVGVAPLPSGLGTTQTIQNADGSYTITDTFTSNAPTGGISQGITIATKVNSKIIENGRIEKVLTVTKNGVNIGSYSIYEDIEPTMAISAFERTNPTPHEQKQILVNQDYSYSANITVPFQDAVYHYGKVDLTLNVPQNFQINSEETLQQFMNTDRDDGYSKVESISQASAGAPVIFKGLQIGNDHTLTIVGRFVMASPSEDQTLMAQPSSAVWTLNGGKQIQVAVPTWGDTILGNETQLPDGNIFKGQVLNAYPTKTDADYPYQDTVPLTSPVDIGSGSYDTDHYINQISVDNPSAYSFNRIHFTATFSDGYSADKLIFGGDPRWPVEFRGHKFILNGRIQVTYQDGSSEVVTEANNGYKIDPSKNLAKVEWIDGLASGKSVWLYVLGKVAKNKQDGQPMQVGDKLTASVNLAPDAANPEFTVTSPVGWTNTQTVVQRVTTPWTFKIDNTQNQYEAGTTSAGYFQVEIPQGLDNADLVNPHIYYVLPTTLSFNLAKFKDQYYSNGSNNQDKIIPFKVSAYQVNGRTVIEYDGSGLTIPGYTALGNFFNWYNLRDDLPNMSSDGYVFASADNLASTNPLATADQQSMLRNAVTNHTFQVGKFTIAVQSATGLAMVENAQGNTDSSLLLSGHSDDKGSAQMTFSTGLVYNPEQDSVIHNVVVVANLPKTNTGTVFDFRLNPNGATAVSSITGEALPAGSYEILYSTQPGKLSNEKTDLSSYVAGDQVSDWSQVKSVALKINELSKQNGAVRLVLQGEDPTVTTDAGKVAYLSGQAWSDEHLPMSVAAATAGSSSIKVDGQSTVKARLHYKDAQGKDQYIALDDLTHQYKDNQDTMQTADFALSADDQKLIPAGYHLSSTPTIINGAQTWQTNAENGTAAFGQVVKYYFDGDIVQFELSNQAAAQLKYYDDTTQQFISGVEPTNVKGNIDTAISFAPTTLNGLTDRYDYVGISRDDEKNTVDPTAFASYQFGNYDNDDQTTQTFVVHLKHGVEPVDGQHPYPVDPQNPARGNVVTSKTVNRTITYKFSDGSTHATAIPTNPVTQATTFTGTGHVDKVTGKLVDVDGQGDITKTYDNPNEGIHWTATRKTTDDGTLEQQKSPSVAGYTPDKSTVEAVTVHHNSNDITTVVTYTPDQQVAQLTFYDDTTGQAIQGKQDHSTGVTNGTISFSKGGELLKSLTDQGYEFVKVVDNTNQQPQDLSGDQYGQVTFPNFDDDDQLTQKFVVHLKHGTKAVSDAKTVNETIHYRYADGTLVTGDYRATPVEFKRTGVEDLVTHEIDWTSWTPADGSFAEVTSPMVPGYHADKVTVAGQTVTPDSKDLEITVTYVAEPQPGTSSLAGTGAGEEMTSLANTQSGAKDAPKKGAELPQTGNHQSGSLVGLGLISVLALLGLTGRKRRQN